MNGSTYSIRKCGRSDLDTLVELRLEFLKEAGHIKEGEDIAGFQSELKSFIDTYLNKDLFMWLVEADGRTVATGAVSIWDKLPTYIGKGSKTAYIANMYTRPEYRKRGIASAVVAEINNMLRSQGVPKVMLHALEDGKRVYANAGFKTNDSYMEMKLV